MTAAIRTALERQDLAGFSELLDPEVVWVGVGPGQLCRNREQVLATFERALQAGRRAEPEILAEVDDKLVLDPHVEPPPELNPTLHQILVVSDGHIVEIRDYPDRRRALQAVGLR